MVSVPRSQSASRVTTHEIQVATPYRLDLTVAALRRIATNLVDVHTSDGHYSVRSAGSTSRSSLESRSRALIRWRSR